MSISDDVHDIRYLHDENAPHDHEPSKLPDFRSVLKYKRIGAALGILIVIGGISILIFNISLPQDPRSRASENIQNEKTTISGTVTCIKSENEQCKNLAIVTDDGDTIELEDSPANSSATQVKEGDYIVVKGTVSQSQNANSSTPKKITIENLQSLGTAKTPTPTSNTSQGSSTNPSPTVNDAPLITPTPTPQVLKNNTPEPGIEYVSATYVIENKTTLNGKVAHVQSFLVGGYIGVPGCSFAPDCNESHFVLNDNNASGRDTNFDLSVIGGTTDQEGDYAPGQEFFTSGTVSIVDGVVNLDKIK